MTKEEIKRTVPNIPGIYRIYNIDTNKSYIGQAIKLKKRLLEHLGTFSKNNLQNIAIYRAFNCHGEDKFSFEILYKVDFEYNGKEELKSILDEKEKYYIKEYDSYKNGYNSTEGGDYGVLGFKHCEITKQHLKEKTVEQRYIIESDKNNWIRCKDWYSNCEYISISQTSLSNIILEHRESINRCLNKKQNNIKNRYTFCYYYELMPELVVHNHSSIDVIENRNKNLKILEYMLEENPKLSYLEFYKHVKVCRKTFFDYKKILNNKKVYIN